MSDDIMETKWHFESCEDYWICHLKWCVTIKWLLLYILTKQLIKDVLSWEYVTAGDGGE